MKSSTTVLAARWLGCFLAVLAALFGTASVGASTVEAKPLPWASHAGRPSTALVHATRSLSPISNSVERSFVRSGSLRSIQHNYDADGTTGSTTTKGGTERRWLRSSASLNADGLSAAVLATQASPRYDALALLRVSRSVVATKPGVPGTGSFKAGVDFETTLSTKAGNVQVIAEVEVNGSQLVIKD